MLDAYKCDKCYRCGELFKYTRSAFSAWYSVSYNTLREGEKQLDLCPRCERQLADWIAKK